MWKPPFVLGVTLGNPWYITPQLPFFKKNVEEEKVSCFQIISSRLLIGGRGRQWPRGVPLATSRRHRWSRVMLTEKKVDSPRVHCAAFCLYSLRIHKARGECQERD